jgi:DNA (cytosine-5)-methyltransferase 1
MDIREFNDRVAPSYEGMVDVLCAGFPCQPFSQNGKQSGEQDERNQWPGTIAAIRIIQPQFVFLENVPGLQNFYYYSKILSELRGEGFTLQSGELAACDIGAPVEKRRLFILASPNSINGEPRMGFIEDRPKPLQQRDSESLSEYWIQAADRASGGNCWDSRYVDRGKAVGNIQVPIVAAIAEAILMRNIG